MKLYRYNTDRDAYQGVGVSSSDHELVLSLHFQTSVMSCTWKPLTLRVNKDGPKRQGDFPSLGNYSKIPIFSQRAWDALCPLIGSRTEALAVKHLSGNPYYIINVLEKVDCLDEERSEVARRSYDGRITWVYKFCLKPDLIAGKNIFKTALKSGSDVIVSEEFRRVVEDNKLKGLVFEDLPMVGEPKRQKEAAGSVSELPDLMRKDEPVTGRERTAIKHQIWGLIVVCLLIKSKKRYTTKSIACVESGHPMIVTAWTTSRSA